MMAEGGYDPTTQNETPWEDHGIDNDGDNDEVIWNEADLARIPVEPNSTQPFQPQATSTPYHGGEAHEMVNMDEEGDGIPLIPEYDDFRFTEDKETLVNRFKAFIKAKRPRVDFSKLVIGLGKKQDNQGKAVVFGPKGGETVFFKQDGNFTAKFSQQYSSVLGPSAENIIAEDQMTLRDTQTRLKEAQQAEARLNTQVEKQEQETQERQRLETQLEQINQRIDNMEKEGGTVMERQMETDRLERESAKLKRDIKEAKEKEKGYAQTAKAQGKVAKEVERLKRQYAAQKQRRDTTEATLNKTKPLDELEKEAEELKRKIEEDRRIMNDKEATSQERMAAGERFSQNTDELARLDPQIQEREQELPLRERVKSIFKKYGRTLQAVALAVGIVLSALALAATKGLKAGTKALGQGLKAIGQKLGSLLPGRIGSIVSYIFKAAGSVLSFLAEHAWLLILAVVAFFMERLLKRKRK